MAAIFRRVAARVTADGVHWYMVGAPMHYVDIETEMPAPPEVVWSRLVEPSGYGLFVDGLAETGSAEALEAGASLRVAILRGQKRHSLLLEVTAFRPPTTGDGLLGLEARLSQGDLILMSVRLAPASTPATVTKVHLTLELMVGNRILALFERPFGLMGAAQHTALRAPVERSVAAFRKLVESHAVKPYRGRSAP